MQKRLLLPFILLSSSIVMAQNSKFILAVDEYVPAPGQFINVLPEYSEGDTPQTMAQKCTDAIANNAGHLVSLGAWGGYITFHFDHPIVNIADQYDLYIQGNAIDGCSEAGIVCVSQDQNHNGLPDDPWFEISGSADKGATEIWYDYEVTYQFTEPLSDIFWTDNLGASGVVNRNNFHQQEYFPLWLDSSLTLRGTRLPDNAEDSSGNGSYWVLHPFEYGYVDNLPNKDTLGCSINLDWAVDPITRQHIELPYIDFVRVYTALNQDAGWLGETSTEISGAIDLHPDAEVSLQTVADPKEQNLYYDLFGRTIRSQQSNHKLLLNNKIILL